MSFRINSLRKKNADDKSLITWVIILFSLSALVSGLIIEVGLSLGSTNLDESSAAIYSASDGTEPLAGTTITMTIENLPTWESVNLGNWDNSDNIFAIIIDGDTNVKTDTMVMGSDNLNNGESGDSYDYIGIENILVAENQTSSGMPSGDNFALENSAWDHTQIEPVNGVSGTIPWMDNVPAPASGTENVIYNYFFLKMSGGSAGTYTGTLYIRTVEA